MTLTILPLAKEPTQIDNLQAIEACGLVLPWAQSWDGAGSLKDYLAGRYGFPMPEMEGGLVHLNGLYTYPDDPDLEPLAKVTFDSCVFWQYPYGIVAIVTPSGTFVTRMD